MTGQTRCLYCDDVPAERPHRTARFAGALLLSAFLLFVLEPMVAKSILPTLGGAPMTWNTRLRGTEVVDFVEAEAARDDRFTWALGEIWIVAEGLLPMVCAEALASPVSMAQSWLKPPQLNAIR